LSKPLFLFHELNYVSSNDSFFHNALLKFFTSIFFKELLFDKTPRNFFLFKNYFNFYKKSHLSKKKNILYYNIVYITAIGYMDRFFFKNYIPFESYNYVNAFRFADVLLINNS
jgi:hypothetical protein